MRHVIACNTAVAEGKDVDGDFIELFLNISLCPHHDSVDTTGQDQEPDRKEAALG